MNLTNDASMWICVFGKLYKVLTICKTDAEANEFCRKNPAGAVISEDQKAGHIIVAARDGVKMPAA